MFRVGTSGWVYPPWRKAFYPDGLAQRRELEYLSRKLNSVEINGSFYALQRPDSFRKWFGEVPDDFVFAVKAPRFVTHMKRLRDVHEPIANFFASGMLALETKLGPILWQLPPNLSYDAAVFDPFVASLPASTAAAAEWSRDHGPQVADRAHTVIEADRPMRHAVEVRHPSFVTDAVIDVLRRHGVALVVADSAGKFPAPKTLTADFVYARLHGDLELYTSGYSPAALDTWADRFRAWGDGRDCYVYFDNDAKVHAPYDAMGLLDRLTRP